MSEMPNGWAICSLADIGLIVTGKTPSTKEPRFYDGNIPFIKPGDLDHSGLIYKTENSLTDAGAAEVPSLPPQSIVVTCIGNLGKVGLTTTVSATNQQINAVIPDEGINPNFLLHFCKTLKPWLEKKSSATTISIVNKSIFSEAAVLIAPLAEQTRIAQKLDELLTQVDSLKARIDDIPAQLKRFRQSVLAAAVSGRLTEDWRKMQPNRALSDIADLPEGLKANWWPGGIPDGWQFEYYENIIDSRLGKMLDKAKNSGLPAPYLGNINVRWFKFDTDSLQEILINESERLELAVLNGDVLICEGGEPGRCAIWRGGKQVTVFQKALHRARTPPNLLPEWLVFNIKNDADGNTLAQLFTGTTIKHLTGRALARYPLRLPPIAEQTEIVRRVEQLFAFADNLETKVASAKSRIDNLTQSILAKAFRGELVPQDPNDEPASVLLERIKAQRAATPKSKRSRKTSV